MEEKIKKILRDVKISRTLEGYYLWTELILEIYKNYNVRQLPKVKITKYCEKLAVKYNSNYYAIERSLRFCIENKKEIISDYFRYYEGKITNKKFLILVVERLKESKGV